MDRQADSQLHLSNKEIKIPYLSHVKDENHDSIQFFRLTFALAEPRRDPVPSELRPRSPDESPSTRAQLTLADLDTPSEVEPPNPDLGLDPTTRVYPFNPAFVVGCGRMCGETSVDLFVSAVTLTI